MKKRFLVAMSLLLISATLLGTASFAWFSMNTDVSVDGIEVEAYSDSLFLEISTDNVDYNTAVTLSDGAQVLRLAKHVLIGSSYYTLDVDDADKATGYYTTDTDMTKTYKKIADSADSYHKYVKVPADELEVGSALAGLCQGLVFTATAANATAENGVDYYKFVEGKYVPQSLVLGSSAKGLYTITAGSTTPLTDGNYAGTGKFFANDGGYYEVTGTLTTGTDLSAYYIIDTDDVTEVNTNLDSVNGDVYLAKTGGASDVGYAYVGNLTDADLTKMPDMLYFGRAYSDIIGDEDLGTVNDGGDPTDTLSIIKSANLDKYRYASTIYLRNALNTNNSENLQATVNVGGATNPLAPALRVLLVVSNADTGEFVNVAYYDNGSPSSLTYGVTGTDDNIVDVLLGNKAETLKVDILVYFDGTDEIANNENIEAGVLDGNSVEIKFTIDNHDYNN